MIAGAQRKLVLPTIIYAIFNIGFNLIFIPRFSYIATSASTSLTELLIFVIAYSIFVKTTGMKISFAIIGKIILATLPLALFLLIFKDENLLFLILTGGALYFLMVFWLKIYSRDTIKELIPTKT